VTTRIEVRCGGIFLIVFLLATLGCNDPEDDCGPDLFSIEERRLVPSSEEWRTYLGDCEDICGFRASEVTGCDLLEAGPLEEGDLELLGGQVPRPVLWGARRASEHA
jgi:hypothetical protein